MPIDQITRNDALKFREWWAERVQNGMDPGTANKDTGHLSEMWNTWITLKEVDLPNPFRKLRFEVRGKHKTKIPAFSREWVTRQSLSAHMSKETILAVLKRNTADLAKEFLPQLQLLQQEDSLLLFGEIRSAAVIASGEVRCKMRRAVALAGLAFGWLVPVGAITGKVRQFKSTPIPKNKEIIPLPCRMK